MEKRSNDLYAVAQECLLRNLVCLELEFLLVYPCIAVQ
jgi:hypothetical protein